MQAAKASRSRAWDDAKHWLSHGCRCSNGGATTIPRALRSTGILSTMPVAFSRSFYGDLWCSPGEPDEEADILTLESIVEGQEEPPEDDREEKEMNDTKATPLIPPLLLRNPSVSVGLSVQASHRLVIPHPFCAAPFSANASCVQRYGQKDSKCTNTAVSSTGT